MKISFKIYNIRIHITGESDPLVQGIVHDFNFFPLYHDRPEISLKIDLIKQRPDRSVIDKLYFFSHLGSKVYGWGDLRFIEHPQALVCFNAKTHEAQIISLDDDLLYHYAYYLIISKSGEWLDLQGLHRFHAFGFSLGGHAAIMSAGIAGGKTTLALEMMKQAGVLFFSEDTPLLDRKACLWPFPVRLCLREGNAAGKERATRSVVDPVVGRKILLGVEYFGADKISRESKPLEKIFMGFLRPQKPAEVKKMPRSRFFMFIFKQIVLGWDCPQRVEFFFCLSPRGIISVGQMLWGRLRTAWAVFCRTEGYCLFMSNDIQGNIKLIRQALDKEML